MKNITAIQLAIIFFLMVVITATSMINAKRAMDLNDRWASLSRRQLVAYDNIKAQRDSLLIVVRQLQFRELLKQ